MQLPSPGLFTVLAACFGLSTDTAGASAPAYLGYERTALRSVHGHTNEAACGLIIMSETEYDEDNMTEKEKQDYFDRHIDEIPEGCLACGGPYPTCKDSCALFDD